MLGLRGGWKNSSTFLEIKFIDICQPFILTKYCSSYICPIKNSSGENSSGENSFSEISSRKVGFGKICLSKVNPSKISICKISTFKAYWLTSTVNEDAGKVKSIIESVSEIFAKLVNVMQEVFVKVPNENAYEFNSPVKDIVKVASDGITVEIIGNKSVAEVVGAVENIDEIAAKLAEVIVVL